jgi:GAF domain
MVGSAMAKHAAYFERVTKALQRAAEASRAESDPERAVTHMTHATRDALGDPSAPSRPGALKPGEQQFIVGGIFFLAPDRRHMTLMAAHGYPAAQRYARISSADSRPGHAVQTGKAALVPNTDIDTIFRQILASGRVGCSMYTPVKWGTEVIGLFNTAAQARFMYDETDLAMQELFANLAAATWVAKGGTDFVAGLGAALPPWQPATT